MKPYDTFFCSWIEWTTFLLRFSNQSYFTDSSAHATVGQKYPVSCDQLQLCKIMSVGKREDTDKHGRIKKEKIKCLLKN